MRLRFNPPPNWPPPPPGFVPPPRWQPDPAWPPPPPGWELWVADDDPPARTDDFLAGAAGVPPRPPGFSAGPTGQGAGVTGPAGPYWPGDPGTGADDFGTGPDSFGTGADDFGGGADSFGTGVDDFGAGAGDFGARADDFGGGADGFGAGADDFPPGPAGYLGEPPPGEAPFGPPSGRTNGFAVAAFILGLLGIGILLSYIFGVVALRQIRFSGQRGRGLAIAGLSLSALWTVLLVAVLVLNGAAPGPKTPVAGGTLAGSSSQPSSSSSQPSSSPSTGVDTGGAPRAANVFALTYGECFQNPPSSQAILGITSVTVSSCDKPHNAQVFVQFPVTGSKYPGTAALKNDADQGCHKRIARNLITSKITSTMTLQYLYPLAGSWAQGHRTITCLVVDAKPDLKASLLRPPAKH